MRNVLSTIVLIGRIVDTVIPVVSNVVKAFKLWCSERKKSEKVIQ